MFDGIFQTFRQPWLSVVILLYIFILILGKCLLYISTRCLWNVSKACCVSLDLLISSQLMLLMAWQKFSLFWKLYNLLNIYVSFSLISILSLNLFQDSSYILQWLGWILYKNSSQDLYCIKQIYDLYQSIQTALTVYLMDNRRTYLIRHKGLLWLI